MSKIRDLFSWTYTTLDQPDYREYLFLSAWWAPRCVWRFQRWKHDGLPRLTIQLGWLVINAGKSYDWLTDD